MPTTPKQTPLPRADTAEDPSKNAISNRLTPILNSDSSSARCSWRPSRSIWSFSAWSRQAGGQIQQQGQNQHQRHGLPARQRQPQQAQHHPAQYQRTDQSPALAYPPENAGQSSSSPAYPKINGPIQLSGRPQAVSFST